jgi:hypothetical protein
VITTPIVTLVRSVTAQPGRVVTQSWRSKGRELFLVDIKKEIWWRQSGENRREFRKIKMWQAFANKSFVKICIAQHIAATAQN